MKKLVLFFSLFLFSCEKSEIVVESTLINFGSCPSDVPTNKVIKFIVNDNPTVDYYVVEYTEYKTGISKSIKIEPKKTYDVETYECEIEMKSKFYTSRVQVVYNKKYSKYFDREIFITNPSLLF